MGEKSKIRGHYPLKMRALALMLSLMMVLTTSGFQTFAEEVGASAQQTSADQAAKDKAEAEAAAARRAAEEEARRAAEAAAAEAAAKAAAEEAARKAAEEKAAAEQAAAESEAAAKAAAESEAAAKAAAEKEAAEKAAAEQAAAEKAAAEQAAAQKAAEESEAAAKAAADSDEKKDAADDGAQKAESEAAKEQPSADTGKEPASDKKEENKKQDNDKEQTVTYRVSFDGKAAEHGTIRVENQEAAVSTYYKEVKENGKFTFTVTPAEGWKVDTVKVEDNNVPKTANVNEYEIAAVAKDAVIKVTYQELPKEADKTDAETEVSTEDAETEAGETEAAAETEETIEEAAEDAAVKNVVTFQAGVGVTITSDGADVTNGTGMAKDGTILFTVVPTEGYEVTSVLVDGTKEARGTENVNEYIIENIKTDDTTVSVSAEWVGVETETEVESEPETETEESMPAFTYSKEVNGVVVSINAPEGVLPEGTTAVVTPLSTETAIAKVNDSIEEEVVDAIGFNIALFDKDGKEIQPDGNVQVTFSGVSVEGETAAIAHVADNGAVEVVEEDIDPEAGEVGFTADSFSDYIFYGLSQATYDANSLADEGTRRVEVGKSIPLYGKAGGWDSSNYHQWSVEPSDNDVVSITGSGQNVSVTGQKVGKVTITHKYKTKWNEDWNSNPQTFIIEVVEAAPGITVTPETATLNLKGATTTLTATLSGMDSENIVVWTSSDPSVATVSNGVVTAVGTGTAVITATVRPDDDELEGQTFSDTTTISVNFENSKYTLYYYALIPGQAMDGGGNANDKWFGLGMTYIQGVPNPSTLSTGKYTGEYQIGDVQKKLYPDLEYNGVIYEYAENSENADKEGYYTLEPARIVVADGANAGNNGYNDTASGNQYHWDFTMVMNEKDIYTVLFEVKDPGTTNFAALNDYSQRVSSGTSESSLKKPTRTAVPDTKIYNGITYEFDGWYKDEECTQKASFDGTVTSNTIYYGKYVPTKAYYSVEYYYAGVLDSSKTDTFGPVDINTVIETYTSKDKAGYEFDYDDGKPLTITADSSENVIKVYYKKKQLSYTVNYYLNGTNYNISPSENGNGTIGEEITEEPKAIEGYVPVSNPKTITLVDGENVINFYYRKQVTLTAKSDTKVYNGELQSVSGFTVEGEIDGYPASFNDITVGATGKDAGTYPAEFGSVIGEQDSSGKYVVGTVVNGKLAIDPATLTVVTPNGNKVYDGTALTAKGSVTGFVNGETAGFETTGIQTEVGTSSNTYEITWADAEGENGYTAKESNYTVNETVGTLTVTEYADEIVVTTTGGTYTYDGEAHGATVAVSELPDGYTLETATSNATATDVTEEAVAATCDTLVIKNAAGEDVTDKLKIKKVDGSITITPATLTVTTPDASKVYDGTALTAEGSINGLVNGETVIFTTTGSQTYVGESKNTYEIVWADETQTTSQGGTDSDEVIVPTAKKSNYTVVEKIGTLEVTDGTEEEPVDPNGVVTKNHGDANKQYALGDTVTFTINVKNIYDEDKTITITELPGVEIAGASENAKNVLVVRDVKPGETVTATATYTITEADIAAGKFINTVKAAFSGGKEFSNTDEVKVEPVNKSYTLVKTASQSDHESDMFKVGETIHYTITVTNTGNQTLENVVITDTLDAAGSISNVSDGVTVETNGKVTTFTIASLAAQADPVVITYDYVVQEADRGNKISNAAVGSLPDPEKPDPEDPPKDETETTVENPGVSVEKTVVSIQDEAGNERQPAEGETEVKAQLDDVITYQIVVKNTGNVKLTNVTIEDSLTGIEVPEGAFAIDELAVNAEETITYTYKVKESDLGKVVANKATVTADVPEDPEEKEKPTDESETETPTVDVVKAYTVEKEASKSTHESGMFKVGETIQYKVTVTNTGNQTLEGITLTDTLEAAGTITNIEGAEYVQNGKETVFIIPDMAPKSQPVVITYDYEIQEEDAGNAIRNAVVGTPADPDEPETPGDNTETEVENPGIEVEKTVLSIVGSDGTVRTAPEGEAVEALLNDVITYEVTVRNTGNVKLENIDVTDSLEGITILEGSFQIESLEAGATETVRYTYTVAEKDLGGVVHNVATATAEVPEDPEDAKKPGDTDEKDVPTDDRNPRLEVTKRVTSTPMAADGRYVLGETITYEVTVTNTGNLTMTDIVVSDAMTRPDGTLTIPSGIADIDTNIGTLAPGESRTITYTHVVTEADLGGSLTNAATATGTPEIPNPDPENKPDPDPTGRDDETVVTDDPENCTITVTKQTFSGLDEPIILAEGAEFRVALFSDEAMTTQVGEARTIRYDGNSSTAQVTFDNLKRGTYYVAEVDASGAVLTAGEYDGGAFVPVYDNGNSVVITENGGSGEFRFNNSFLILPTSYYDAKPVTITKNVKDIHGKAMKSTETFYAGIFTDADYTKLADTDVVGENIIPLKMNGKSSVSATIEMKVPQTDENVQLYITEVTSAGKPVGEGFGYDMEVENGSLTLNTETVEETVTITNTSNREEEEEEETKTNTSTKEQNSSKSTSDSTKAIKTGDETPILPYTGLLGISALYILIFLAKRRRREEA